MAGRDATEDDDDEEDDDEEEGGVARAPRPRRRLPSGLRRTVEWRKAELKREIDRARHLKEHGGCVFVSTLIALVFGSWLAAGITTSVGLAEEFVAAERIRDAKEKLRRIAEWESRPEPFLVRWWTGVHELKFNDDARWAPKGGALRWLK